MMKKILNLFRNPNKWVMMCLMLVVGIGITMAQNTQSGKTAIENVAKDIAAYVPSIQALLYAIAGVVALGGAVSVYIKMNNEEQDVKKSIMLVVGACIFLIAAAEALPMFFGY